MCDAIMELMAGPLQKREEKGEALAKIKQICKKIQKQVRIADIADMIEEDLNFVEQICSIAPDFAPDYPAEDIYNKWMETKEKNLNI